jgi:hypothetical protein
MISPLVIKRGIYTKFHMIDILLEGILLKNSEVWAMTKKASKNYSVLGGTFAVTMWPLNAIGNFSECFLCEAHMCLGFSHLVCKKKLA